MKKLLSLFVLFLLMLGLLAACGENKEKASDGDKKASEPKTEQASFPVTLTDALKQKVVIKTKPERIVSLMPSNTETVFALGLGDKVVGVSDFDNYPEEATKKEKIGGQEINLEKIIALKPDLVLAHASSAHNSESGLNQLRDAGIPVVVVNDAQSFDGVYDSILLIGKATGEVKKADDLVTGMKEKLAEIKEKVSNIKEKKKVFVEVAPAPEIYSTGSKTFMDEMLTAIQAENIIGDQEGWVKVDQEAIVERNPDVIITTYGGYEIEKPSEQIVKRKGWENVTAIKNKQVVDVDSDRVTRSGPRIIEGVEDLAKAIYPEVFQ
ncbi:ABC transporter substrate-binding protein [Bacillus rubiinfantis]|uniref:ABC transporter substrate-binding protein n=1 Tax=Bacillus rubiinfantis TaxID=1499680 RepID=UPI0005A7B4CC|nr:ABC transporter substrate-binding protein [Bacillus rubiinfantis]